MKRQSPNCGATIGQAIKAISLEQKATPSTPYRLFLAGHSKLPARPVVVDGRFPVEKWRKLTSKAFSSLTPDELKELQRVADERNRQQEDEVRRALKEKLDPSLPHIRERYVINITGELD